jgi:diguanylate cyclase (GGDEF)-like protein
MMIDVDHFKTINDRFGHLAGDDCLKLIADVVAKQISPASALVARIGGEEFGILLAGMRIEAAYEIAVAIRRSLRLAPWQSLHPDLADVTVSIGLCAGEGPLDATRLYARADEALYAAKRNGRDRIEILGLPQMPLQIAG